MKRLFNYFTLFEKLMWLFSIILIIFVFYIYKNNNYLYLIGNLIGVTALLFLAKGNPVGQILSIVFSLFYAYVSLSYRYYGECITYAFMTLPVAVVSTIAWFKHPYQDNNAEVEVVKLKLKDYLVALGLSLIITVIFYFVLKALNTNNLILSTISIFTSFLAAYITARRSRFYALFYALNDIVLIVLWILASLENKTYTSMVICFVAFLASDLYAFINWGKLEKNQGLTD